METVNQQTGISHSSSRTAISLDRIYKNEFQKEGTLTAQIRQVVTTTSVYPSKRVGSDLQNNLFATQDFGFENQIFTSNETRVAWLLIPQNSTEAEVLAKIELANKNGACIYRVLSNTPILDENQKYGISAGLTTKDNFANSQAVRYGVGHAKEGQLTLDKNGNVQYRRTFFWNSPMDDQDARSASDVYLSAELAAEMKGASIMTGQSL